MNKIFTCQEKWKNVTPMAEDVHKNLSEKGTKQAEIQDRTIFRRL